MEGQLQRTHHRYEEDPHHQHHPAGLHSVMEGEGETEHNHHSEKKSVLTKVKHKAKKIKDKITHAGHTHDEDDDDNDDDETVNPSGVHVANEPAFISGTALPKQTGQNLGNPTNLTSHVRDEAHDDAGNVGATMASNTKKMSPSIGGDPLMKTSDPLLEKPYSIPRKQEYYSGPRDVGAGLGKAAIPAADDLEQRARKEEYSGARDVGVGLGKVPQVGKEDHFGPRVFLGKDDEVPQVGKEDHFGPRDVGVGTRDVGVFLGKDDHFGDRDVGVGVGKDDHHFGARDVGVGLGKVPQEEEYSGARDVGVGLGKVPKTDRLDTPVAEPMMKIGPLADLEEDPHSPKTYPGATRPLKYQAKVVDPTGQGGEEMNVDPLLQRLDNLHVDDKYEPKTKSEEMAYTGSHDQFAPQPIPTSDLSHDDQFTPQPIPVDDQFNPKSLDSESPESTPRDTVAGKLSAATAVITDRAALAKNAVASKLGYGSSQNQQGQDRPQKTTMESVSEYGHRVAEQLAPVYEKAAGAGSAIMSKVHRGGAGDSGGGVVKEESSDKGVSVQSYLVEKFSPGEEDRELSKAITDAFHGRKGGDRRSGEDEDEVAAKEKEMGTETIRVEAVASDEKAAAGVVDRVKGAVGSWLGKNRGQQSGGEGLEREIASKLEEE